MGLLTFLLISVVFGSHEIIINACSLLPGGNTPCFTKTLDQTANKGEKLKEIVYELPPGKEFQYVDLKSKSGLGQYWQRNLGTETDTVICARNTTDGAYLRKYETRIEFLRSFQRAVDGHSSHRKELDHHDHYFYINDFFIITRREVWNCKGKEGTESSSLNFLRIVTQLLGKRSTESLLFYDGFKVVFIPHSKNKGELIPIVREIKYLHPESHEVVKYEGFLEFEQPECGEKENSYFKEIQYYPVLLSEKMPNQFKEVSDRRDKINEQEILNPNGLTQQLNENYETLEMTSPPVTSIGTSTDVAICKRNDEDPTLYADIYHTDWRNGLVRMRKFIKYVNCMFSARFVITKHELWTCKIKRTKQVFTRSIMEYIGSFPYHDVVYSNSVANLWKFVLKVEEQTQSIAAREIAYFNGKKRVYYLGWIEEGEDTPVNKLLSALLPSPKREEPPVLKKTVRDIWRPE